MVIFIKEYKAEDLALLIEAGVAFAVTCTDRIAFRMNTNSGFIPLSGPYPGNGGRPNYLKFHDYFRLLKDDKENEEIYLALEPLNDLTNNSPLSSELIKHVIKTCDAVLVDMDGGKEVK